MTTAETPEAWTALDPWWTAYTHHQSIPRSADESRVFGLDNLAKDWDEIEPWWREYTRSTPVTPDADTGRVLDRERRHDWWEAIDPWWDEYTAIGHETAVRLAALLEDATEEWRHSDAPFDTDPLAADLTRERLQRGPLQPGGEVDWSRWLAQLLRTSPSLVSELFPVAVDQPPAEVRREEQLSKEEGTFRRPDVLLLHDDWGISIEVKLDDENYRKTPDTAAVVEEHYHVREWEHVLLLPNQKTSRLDSIVDPPLITDGDHRTIEWEDPGPVTVVYWRDVTRAIRSVLLRGDGVDAHWAANAYLFCAVAEQQLLDFQPQPVVEDLADPEDAVDSIQPIGIVDTLVKEIRYLRARPTP